MTLSRSLFLFPLWVHVLTGLVWCQPESVRYTVSLAERQEHLLRVRMEVDRLKEQEIRLSIPAWSNLYQIRDFARFIRRIEASCGEGSALEMRRFNLHTWAVQGPCEGPLVIEYVVHSDLPGSFSTEVNTDHAFLHPAMVCLYLPDHRGVPHRISFTDIPEEWRIATGLDSQEGVFEASDYDHLIDSPFELSNFRMESFQFQGVEYQLVVDGSPELFPMSSLVEMVRPLVEYQVQLMRGAPFERFVFIYHFSERGSGGMEHRNSTAIGLSAESVEKDIQSASGITAHEFFHAWNVKKIRPRVFDRMDWSREVLTRSLWFSEGATSYYSLLTRVRTGSIDPEEFLKEIAGQIRMLQSREGRLFQSVEESSLETWFDKYSDYAHGDRSISYYNKGLLVSLLLDLKIREHTRNRKSLDDVVRFLDENFGDRGVGFRERDLQRAVEKVARADFSDFFQKYVSGVVELPYGEYFDYAGWNLDEEVTEIIEWGFETAASESGSPIVSSVLPGSAASLEGLLPGDRIVRVNGRVVREDIGTLLLEMEPGLGVALEVSRGEERLDLRFEPLTREVARVEIRESDVASAQQLAIRGGLLTGNP